ncbi:sodium/proton antiporter family protein [Syntrophotalea carbinolica DSM 2380]|uniref:Na(+)/H(+) antiporter NhaA 2 n=1 Tax=Syntrophotalea carbinolica (strain DSM 2380 / NBRC 103641 / GraBd1) TaxID=338963 RepID=NHAA2_SYNC1|nr:Na+/H+ antiporter NhaA [Syntrophotalea carbinolica]Q3A1R2.1 RecName: Full=Na(+)/H(+) antiporter NhaA 2; AltName: Full=Sodium/proton antiporter NhaA 2 [Syntrophotalea carbinolica DSM 2380]ABA89695.1 sodium/proton antiporter family protein [Syntrophotalea carbinolica DSM 2380]
MPFRIAFLKQPFEDFFKHQASGGIVLLGATVLALVLANSPWSGQYFHFWEIKLTIGFDHFGLTQTLHHWINDGLMAVFFFLVGLELKREFMDGELASFRQAMLPIAAAFGGMLVPALIFHFINPMVPEAKGWGIPMATDIAFALGVLALLRGKISRSLAIFLTALAIVDDLGAVLVIALFYSGELAVGKLLVALVLLLILIAGNRLGVQSLNFYGLLGFCLWVVLLKSGLHASIAGVLIGMVIPARPRLCHEEFVDQTEKYMARYKEIGEVPGPFHHEERLGALLALEHICHDAMSSLQRMEHELHHWVIFGVIPIFALANAGLVLQLGNLVTAVTHPVTLGVALGLLLGKPLGILFFSWISVRVGLCALPRGTSWMDVFGVGILGGIGFTMSLFISNLAFMNIVMSNNAKLGIFIASMLAGAAGFTVLSRASARKAH